MASQGSKFVLLPYLIVGVQLGWNLCFSFLSWTAHYTPEGKLVERFYNSTGQLYHCQVYGDRRVAEETMALIPRENQFLVDDHVFRLIVDECSALDLDHDPTTHVRRKRVIFPGTKWCGDGDIASSYGDLGRHKGADQCCRSHDHCPVSIAPGESKYGLTNNGLFYVLSCNCSNTFYTCLKNDNSFASNAVGVIYFNVVAPRCLAQRHPKNCTGFWFWKQCTTDSSKPETWAFVDFNKSY